MKMMKFTRLSPLFAAAALFVGSSALAGTDQADLTISANVAAACSITTGSLAFGAYDPTSATDATGSGSFSITCTNGAPVSMMLGQGANADTGSSDDSPMRRMNSGSNYLAYSLYQDAGHTSGWGNSENSDKTSTGTGASESHTFYGLIAAGQNAAVGSYSDTVVATVSF